MKKTSDLTTQQLIHHIRTTTPRRSNRRRPFYRRSLSPEQAAIITLAILATLTLAILILQDL